MRAFDKLFLRRGVVLGTLLSLLGPIGLAGVMEGVVPRDALVRVFVERESVGILLKQGKFIPETTIQEVAKFTGFVFDDLGHVAVYMGEYRPQLENGDISVTVELPDGKRFPAHTVGVDERLSIVVLATEIPVKRTLSLRSLPGADPKHFSVVPASGVECGVASACITNKESREALPYTRVTVSEFKMENTKCRLQGGLALDLDGALVGIVTSFNSHKFSKKLKVSDLLPASIVERSLTRIVETGRSIPAGWLGVYFQPDQLGAQIYKIVPGSPAQRADLRVGDYVVALDDHEVRNLMDLIVGIRWRGPRGYCKLRVNRAGTLQDVSFQLGQRNDQRAMAWTIELTADQQTASQAREAPKVYRSPEPPLFNVGVLIVDLPPASSREMRSPTGGGVMVAAVQESTPGSRAGLVRGDLLFEINGIRIDSKSDVTARIESADDGVLKIRFVRDGNLLTTVLKFKAR